VRLILILACLITSAETIAQPHPIRVQMGQDVALLLTKDQRYRYPQFQEGRVLYGLANQSDSHLFNYDRLLGVMRLIGDNGDTLVLGNEKSFKYVLIGTDAFAHDYKVGYLEILSDAKVARLGVREVYFLHVLDPRRRGPQMYPYGTGTGRSYPGGNADYLLYPEITFYIVDDDDRIDKVTKSKLLSAFSAERKSVKTYLRKNKVGLKSREDLMKLFEYCNSLYP
jgi:hypothetical protein